jgi:hypothetical protein
MEDLPEKSKLKPILLGVFLFLLGAVVGAGVFYFYATKVMIPQYKNQMIGEMYGGGEAEWGDFFKKVEQEKGEEEYTNPFEGGGGTSEEYVNPFDVIE